MASMTKLPNGKYRVRWREGGRGRRGTPREQTVAGYDKARALMKAKGDLEDSRTAGLPGGNGGWLLERFYEEKFLPLRSEQVTEGTVGTWKRRWAPAKEKPQVWHLQRAWGGWALEEINVEAILEWHARMAKAGASDAQMYRAHDLLSNLLSFARRLRYIPTNEAEGCRPDYAPKRTVGVWQPDTIERIREELIGKAATTRVDWRWSRDRDSVLVAVLAYAGLRPGEALAMTWRQLLDRHLWITHTIPGLDDTEQRDIENGRTKTGKDRRVPLEAFLRLILLEWKARTGPHHEDSPVFPVRQGADECWTYNKWVNWRRAIWTPTLEAVGVEYRKPTHLRHSCVTMWIYAGLALPEVAKRAGHTQGTCLDTYSHAWDTVPERPFNVAEAFAAARREASGQRQPGGLSIVRGGRGRA